MKPVTPVIPGSTAREIVYAKDQPEYQPLPAISRRGINYATAKLSMTSRRRRPISVALFIDPAREGA
jgi:hypothetical protein